MALGAEDTRKGQGGFGFQAVTVAGFNVRLSPAFLSDPELRERIMWRLEEQLTEAVAVLPPAHRQMMRSVPIWVDPVPLDGGGEFMPTALYIRRAAADRLSYRSRHQAGGIRLSHSQTVAYFSTRADTPRNRRELRAFDPHGFRAVQRAWGLER